MIVVHFGEGKAAAYVRGGLGPKSTHAPPMKTAAVARYSVDSRCRNNNLIKPKPKECLCTLLRVIDGLVVILCVKYYMLWLEKV